MIQIAAAPRPLKAREYILIRYVGTLAGRDTFAFTFNRAIGKVNGFTAPAAGMSPIKFIRKYLFFFTALGTFAGDYLEIFKICIPGTMLRR